MTSSRKPHDRRRRSSRALACALARSSRPPGRARRLGARRASSCSARPTRPPPPSCPGKIVNNVEVIPCRVEGHVTGFQAIAGGVPRPYEVPFDGKIVAWSITPLAPSRIDTDKMTTRSASSTNSSAAPRRRGSASCARWKAPSRRSSRWSAEPARDSQPYFGSTVIFALDHPLSVLQGQVVASPSPPGRRCSPSTSKKTTPGAAAACRTLLFEEDIQTATRSRASANQTYGCYYSNARLLYTATVVKTSTLARIRPGFGFSVGLSSFTRLAAGFRVCKSGLWKCLRRDDP
jgi:hypothetical protein